MVATGNGSETRTPNTDYQPFDNGRQPPVKFGQHTGFQAVITSPWVLRWAALPATYATYRAIRKNCTVALARELAVTPILASEWSVETDKDTPEEWKKCIEDIFMPLRDDYLSTCLFYGDVDFGYQAYEKIIEPKDGYLKLVNNKQLLQDITEICIGHTGEFIGIRQVGQDLGLNNSMHLGFRVEGSYLYGVPLLENVRQVYNWWSDCNEGARRYDRKIAGCHIIVEYPPGSSTDIHGNEIENAQLAASVLAALESAGGVAIPRDMAAFMQALNLESPGWKIWILDAGGAQQITFVHRLDYLDKQMARGVLIPERAILEGSHGTLAEAEAHGDVIFSMQDVKHRRVTNQLNRQAVNQMLYLNFGEKAVNKVRLKAAPIADKQKAFFAQLYSQLLQSPAGMQELQGLDIAQIRDQLGLPTREETDPDNLDPQGQPNLQAVPGLSQGQPGGQGKQMMAIGPDGKPVVVNGQEPNLAQALSNAIEGMKAVALSATGLAKAQRLALAGTPDTALALDEDEPLELAAMETVAQPAWQKAQWPGSLTKKVSLEDNSLLTFHAPNASNEGAVSGEPLVEPEDTAEIQQTEGLTHPRHFWFMRSNAKQPGENYIKHTTELTGQGRAMEVMSHATTALKQLLQQNPTHVEMTAEADEPSRQRLYRHMLRRLSQQHPDYKGFIRLARELNGLEEEKEDAEPESYFLIHRSALLHPAYRQAIEDAGLLPAPSVKFANVSDPMPPNEGAANLPVETGGLGGGMPELVGQEDPSEAAEAADLVAELSHQVEHWLEAYRLHSAASQYYKMHGRDAKAAFHKGCAYAIKKNYLNAYHAGDTEDYPTIGLADTMSNVLSGRGVTNQAPLSKSIQGA
jgi:hypothetical protein